MPSARSETWVLGHPLLKGNLGIIYLVGSAHISPKLFANWSLLNWDKLQEEGWRAGSTKTNPDPSTSECFLQLCLSKAFIDGYWQLLLWQCRHHQMETPAQKTSFLHRLKKNYIIQFKLSQLTKRCNKNCLVHMELNLRSITETYTGFHCKKEIFQKVVLHKGNYTHTKKSPRYTKGRSLPITYLVQTE